MQWASLKRGTVLSAALLIAGNSIGTGFFSLPFMTAPAGFFPGLAMGFLAWLFLIASGLLYLEAILTAPDGANVFTICRNLIGPFGMALGAISFLVMNLYFMSSYYIVATDFFNLYFAKTLHLSLPPWFYHMMFTLLFGAIIYMGVLFTDRINFLFCIGLFVTLFTAIFIETPHIEWERLVRQRWYMIFFAFPVFLNAYDYQSVLPTLSSHLNRNPQKLKKMVWIGMCFPLVSYSLWQWFALGTTPPGVLWQAYETQTPIYEGVLLIRESSLFEIAFHQVAIFAISTSLFASGLAAVDFFADGFKIPLKERKGLNRLYLCLLVFVPVQLLSEFSSFLYVQVFAFVAGWAEIFFDGALPTWLVIRARYILRLKTYRLLPGGKLVLLLMAVATFFIIYLEGVQLIIARF